jgi:N-acetylglucosamine malate deacetylase 2
MAGPAGVPSVPNRDDGLVAVRHGRALPGWRSVLAVVAHPDDESFGLGAVIDAMTSAGAAVHVLCFTHGEASTLNACDADLASARVRELQQASAELGVAGITLLGYPDAGLAAVPRTELKAHVIGCAARHSADGLLVFDDTGITGHRDHQAAKAGAVTAAMGTGLSVLAWTLPASIAGRLVAETGASFVGRPPDQVDICVRVDRARQRRAALLHASQISPAAVLWRRLQLQGDCEHLRWIR